jgi:hypothetical protein
MNKFEKEVFEKLDTTIESLKPEKTIFEDSNFRIDSKGWKTIKKKGYKENPEKDVWEITEGEYKGEQLFTWDAAMRETKKAGKEIPTREDFEKEFTDVIPNFTKAGYRVDSNATLFSQDSYGYYWSSSVYGAYAYYLYFSSGGVNPAPSSRANGFSVRCLK